MKNSMLPSLVEDVGDAGGGNAGTANGKAVSKVVVVKLNAGAAFLIGYNVGILVQYRVRRGSILPSMGPSGYSGA